ncbi:MAG: Gfo/Idh/MocA family oxidoreductase [Chloroflexota bacterium]
MSLTGLVLGTGFAGQGHSAALRSASVEVVGMVGRTPEVLDRVATDLEIPYTSTNWLGALSDLKPDIVAIGTPGGAHVKPIMAALAHNCHIFCDKPLAPTAADAKKLYREAKKAGVKTAYAASFRYQPHVLLAKELIAQGAIGEPQEVECISHYNLNPLIPFGWSHRLDQGGGRLNNNFTHVLSIVLHVLDGEVLQVNGTTRSDMTHAPIVAGNHHFLERHKLAPDSADDPSLEWGESDAEWSYTVQVQIGSPFAQSQPTSALFKHSGLQPRYQPDYVAIYGSKSAIYIKGYYGTGPLFVYKNGDWNEVPVPDHIMVDQPNIEDHTQRNWNILMRHFAADIRGEAHEPYQTFADGALYQQIIDHIRAGDGWHDLSGK